jgi:ribokinase
MFGAVGQDVFAEKLLKTLKESNVETDAIHVCEDAGTGVAHIWVDAKGENAIAIIAGANGKVDREYVDNAISRLTVAPWLLLQLETPLETLAYLLEQLPPYTPKIILDPAPAQSLDVLPTQRIRLITPNEHELHWFTGLSTKTDADIQLASEKLIESTGVQAVLCKAGSRGAYYFDGNQLIRYPAFEVEVVDSTAAGDAFNGALAVALSEGKVMDSAIRFANAAGALCVTAQGAQQSIPLRKDVEAYLRTESPTPIC